MTATVTPAIDLGSLPAPTVIEALDYEARLTGRLASLRSRFAGAGVAYDLGGLEFDPALILQQEECYRELIDRARINDAVRSVLPAYATGADLDAIALRAGITRLVLSPAMDTVAAVLESDAALLRRYLAAFGRPSAGSVDGYAYAALTALPTLHDVAVLGPAVHGVPGRATVVLLPPEGQALPADAVAIARRALDAETVRPMTDQVTVQAAEIVPYTVSATLSVPFGPDPGAVRSAAEAALRAYAGRRYRIGVAIPATAVAGALYVPNVLRVVMASPAADLEVTPMQALRLTALTLTTEVVG